MMALETQICGDSPEFTIDCVLANGSRQLEADGCVLEYLEGGYQLTTPDHLRAGDLVKIQLWLEGEEAFIDIRLAQVQRVHKHWIGVDVIQVSSNDRMRLTRFLDVPAPMHIEASVLTDHLLIRA
ncbi:MAG: hypothetical protein E6K65_08145 [Nitrospirae bacterium]|nr:MAG: hypothetical protein E6K65_08145 [Nitrospirota bacterium]